MNPEPIARRRPRGQTIPIMAVGMGVMLAVSALVVDGGNAWAQERGTQNASDAASLAGTTVILSRMGGATPTGADVDAAVQAAFTANATTFVAEDYVAFDGTVISPVDPGGAIPADAAGVHARGSRVFNTLMAGIVGIRTLTSGAEATSIAGTATGVCAAISGCGVLPVTFSINVTDCAGNGNIQIGTDLWPIVPLETAQAERAAGIGTHEAIYPLCKVGPGGVGWLDMGCGTLKQQISNPCNKAFDIPTWIHTSPGNPNSVEDEMNLYAGKVILIPLFDSTCRSVPDTGLPADCTDPGNGNNLYYHIPKFVALYLDHAFIQGNNSPACNSAPGTPVGGNGGTSCLKGWFVKYVINGPVRPFDPDTDSADALSIQLIK